MATPDIFTSDISYGEEHSLGSAFDSQATAEAFETISADFPIASFRYRALKPLLDLLIVFLVLPVALPLGIFLAALIRVTSKGSVLFRHRRIGRFQQPLYVWKFRTMYEDSEHLLEQHLDSSPDARQEWTRTQKLRDDPRITPIGRLLRKTSLDEIPQLLNVLAGDMSIVGPRPIVDEERPKYGKYFPTYTCALPGITGLWQVSGRCDIDYPERVLLDVQYVERWSFWMELKILFKTIRVIFESKGAY